ncbi:MAG: hypothetical protein U9P11_06385 [Pseudomonadota bacterium]|nr:hypothetical protein [Pseudomonadota bacterium]
MKRRFYELEDDTGEVRIVETPLETRGTVADVGKGFKWLCLCCLLSVLGIIVMGWLLLEVIWG